MIILIVDDMSIAIFKYKGHSPATAYLNRPVAIQLAFQGVELAARLIHIINHFGFVQCRQLLGKSAKMIGLNAFFDPVSKNCFSSFWRNPLITRKSLAYSATRYKNLLSETKQELAFLNLITAVYHVSVKMAALDVFRLITP